jgi:hypothetical protein
MLIETSSIIHKTTQETIKIRLGIFTSLLINKEQKKKTNDGTKMHINNEPNVIFNKLEYKNLLMWFPPL